MMSDDRQRRIRVLLADDEVLLRAGIRLILRHADDIDVVAEAGDGAQALELGSELDVDVVLMDIRMPGMDGVTAMEQLAKRAPSVKVVMLTTFGENHYIARALRAGAAGFLLKDTGPHELIHAVRAVAGGHVTLSPQVTRAIVNDHTFADTGRVTAARRQLSELTDREREVLVLLGLGMSNADAAERLYMGEGTVKTHVSHILTKLQCSNRLQAAILAHDAGILPAT
jgi:DNA-binding NarL/FixJ family response regulator